MRGRQRDPMSVIDESLLYDDFDVEGFLKSIEKLKLDTTGMRSPDRFGLGLRARPNAGFDTHRPADRGR